MRPLLSDFAHAIEAEIAFVEKDGGEQSYELLSGQRDENATSALYVFLLADTLRLPEDASGNLRVDGKDVGAMVVSQDGNRLWLVLESADVLPAYLPSAWLVVNETDLLKRLKEKIDELAASGEFGLAPKVFGKEQARVANQAPPPLDDRIAGRTEAALAQCIGSEITFLWGPPGTGKTFTIAALVASLAALGETALVTSHTHAAVEQALWALVEPPGDDRRAGFLHGSQLIDDGKILKVGVVWADKLPPRVSLDAVLEVRARERVENITLLEAESERVAEMLTHLKASLAPWTNRREAEARLERATAEHDEAQTSATEAAGARDALQTALRRAQDVLADAKRSFPIGRGRRVARAISEVETVARHLQRAQAATGTAEASVLRSLASLGDAHARLLRAQQETNGLPGEEQLGGEIAAAAERLGELQAEIRALGAMAGEDAKELVRDASAIFATLTKLYTDRNLINDLKWDTVIIDEASMAMQPLVAYAASRAKKRVVVVGDMYQLPPVVRGDRDGPAAWLGTDVFKQRGITDAVDSAVPFAQLAKLMTQRRMHPDIASVARKLIDGYRDLRDADSTTTRSRPEFLRAIGTEAPLVTVDLSKLRPWCGKVPGSLSRFNFISGQVAVELASLYAAELPEPAEKDPPRIGIVTPYAAQRRYVNKLLQSLNLARWVAAGTVHTFQGNECDVIIFDSVLGEPHWTARFTNPAVFMEVRRDLNVAVTRARHQFVFVGDTAWLRKNAKPNSGYGKLWGSLEEHADRLDATQVVGDGFRTRVAESVGDIRGWDASNLRGASLLTEAEFYPAFVADLMAATERVILYTPFIGKTRWPDVEPYVSLLRERGVDVFLLHKPLSDPEWREGDTEFGRSVLKALEKSGVHLVPLSGVHAKTIVIDNRVVYEGSLNWASQVASYEHMWRFESKEMALIIERLLQLEPIVDAFKGKKSDTQCPNCGGPLVVVNQREKQNRGFGGADLQPVKLGCLQHEEDRSVCPTGYLRRVNARAPYRQPPVCDRGARMKVHYTANGRPWDWRCGHKSCKRVRWVRGDCPS